jgi:bifunctional NMN adenylyltransferase/nudix hydrolase
LREEYAWVQKYKALWANTPYPVIFNTVDAVVIQSGHILIVKRGAMPGKGLWAMPGGYINPDEQLVQSMLRELREETKIQVDEWTLKQCIKKSETFADPHRSARGRVITHAFLIQLPDKKTLPRVKGSDDAEKAKWVPLADLRADNMFEDHYAIIRKLIAGL